MKDSFELSRKIADAKLRIAKSEYTDIGCAYACAFGCMTAILQFVIQDLMEGKPEEALHYLRTKAEE